MGLIVASTLLMVGMAWVYVSNLPLTYSAGAVVLLNPAPGNPLTLETASGSAVQMTVALETEAEILRTPTVADIVSANVGRETPGVGERLSVSVPSNTQMLDITFTSETPEAAREGAQAFAEGYLEYREERAQALQDSRIDRLEEQIEAADENLRRATTAGLTEGEAAYASQEVQLFADRLAQLNNTLSVAQAVSTDPGSVIRGAAPPESSNELPPWIILMTGGVIGLLVGLCLALLREWRRDLLRDSDEAAFLGLPVLASIQVNLSSSVSSRSDPTAHESYRQLRTAVIANGSSAHLLAITDVANQSITGSKGHSTDVAVNLAIVLAEARFSILLMATASQELEIEELLEVSPRPGLAEAIRDGVPANQFLTHTHGISLLTAGLDTVGSRDLTASGAFREIVAELHPQFDYVILAAAAAGSADGDATLLAADSALLVLSPDTITRTLLGATLDRLERLGVETAGAVLVTRAKRSAEVRANEGSRRSGSPDSESVVEDGRT